MGDDEVGTGDRGRGDDAFDRLTLDDSFVKGAAVTEGSHRDRDRDARRQHRKHRRGSRVRRTGRWFRRYAPLLLAALVLIVAIGFGTNGMGPLGQVDAIRALGGLDPVEAADGPGSRSSSSTPSTTADPAAPVDPSASTTSSTITLSGVADVPGNCLIWDQTPGGAGNRDSSAVPCEGEHLFEVTSTFEIDGSPYGPSGPTADEWTQVMETECRSRAAQYLGYPLDPQGRFYPRSILPTPTGWEHGDRHIVCGIGENPTSAETVANGQVPLFVGRVAGADQAIVFPVGTCLGNIDAAAVAAGQLGTPVDCSSPHSVELVGRADASALGGAFPGGQAIADHVGPACRAAAEQIYGGPLPADVGIGNLVVTAEGWGSGHRSVDCTMSTRGPNGDRVLQVGARRAS